MIIEIDLKLLSNGFVVSVEKSKCVENRELSYFDKFNKPQYPNIFLQFIYVKTDFLNRKYLRIMLK